MKTISREASITTKNISALVFLKVAQYPFLALFIILVPRIMGPETYGEYALLISIITIASTLVSFGVTEIFGRYLPEHEARNDIGSIRKLSSNILSLKLLTDLFAAAVLFLALDHYYGGRFPTSYFLILIVVLFLRDIQTVTYSILFGLNKMAKFASRDLMRRVLSLSFTLVLFYYYGLFGAVVSFLIVDGALALLSLFWTKEYFRLKDLSIDGAFLAPALRFGFLFYLGYGLMNIWYRAGNPLIDHFTKQPREIALFDLPCQIFLIMVAFVNIAVGSLVPIFTKMIIAGREDKLVKWSRLATKYTGIFCMAVFAGFVLAGRAFFSLLIGNEFAGIYPNGVILLFGIFPVTFSHIGFVYSIIYNKPGKYLQSLLVSVVTFFVLSVILIPRFVSMGCSVALSISSFVYAICMGYFFRENLYPCLRDYLVVMAFGLIMIPLTFLKGGVLTNLSLAVAFLVIYSALLVSFKSLRIEEIKEAYAAFRDKST